MPLEDRLRSLINQQETRLAKEWLALVAILEGTRTLAEIEVMLAAGDVAGATAGLEAAAAKFADEVNRTVTIAGDDMANFIGRELEVVVSYDQVNQRAVNALQENRFRLIREITQSQRDAFREVLVEGTRRGLNPRQQARALRDSLGLTARQTQAVMNFRRLLEEGDSAALSRKLRDRRFDRTVERAISGEITLTETQIDRMVERYRERWIKFRSETIAQTEALAAVHEGNEQMLNQAFEQGLLSPEDIERKWVTAEDARVRDTHETMQGQVRPAGTPFTSGGGALLRYPGDPRAPASERIRCRCVVTTRIV